MEKEDKQSSGRKSNLIYFGVALFSLILIMSLAVNIYLLKKAGGQSGKMESAGPASASSAGGTAQQQAAPNPSISRQQRVEEAARLEASNELFRVCLKKGVVPLNVADYSAAEIRIYTVMAAHNIFLDDFSVLTGDKDTFDRELASDELAQKFYARWQESKKSGSGKSNFETKKTIFLSVFGNDLSAEEKALFKTKK